MSDMPEMTPQELLTCFVQSSTRSLFRSPEAEDMFLTDLVNDVIDTISLEDRREEHQNIKVLPPLSPAQVRHAVTVVDSFITTARERKEDKLMLINDLIDTVSPQDRLLPPNFYPELSSAEFFSVFLRDAPDTN